MNRQHIVRVQHAPRPDVEPRSRWARWICTCGRRSKLFAFAGYAEGAGRSHAKATGGRMATL